MRPSCQWQSKRLWHRSSIALPQWLSCPKRSSTRLVMQAPPSFGNNPVAYRYDVVFLRPPVRARDVLPTISLKVGVDEAYEANGVLHFQRLTARATQSHFPK